MMTKGWMAAAAALVLAGCASTTAFVPAPQVAEAADGSREITSASGKLICDQARCPVLTAHWSSERAGHVVLSVGLPYQSAQVTGADFHLGASQPVRLRVASTDEPVVAADYPVTAFDVPISLIDALAYKASVWVRVTTADGRYVEETVRTGEQSSDVVDAMRQFLRAVDTASGLKPDDRVGNGGLFDLLK